MDRGVALQIVGSVLGCDEGMTVSVSGKIPDGEWWQTIITKSDSKNNIIKKKQPKWWWFQNDNKNDNKSKSDIIKMFPKNGTVT